MSTPVLALKPLCAAEQLEVARRAPMLTSWLIGLGICEADAKALAHNATLLYFALRGYDRGFYSPRAVLERLSLDEIADLCERLAEIEKEGETV